VRSSCHNCVNRQQHADDRDTYKRNHLTTRMQLLLHTFMLFSVSHVFHWLKRKREGAEEPAPTRNGSDYKPNFNSMHNKCSVHHVTFRHVFWTAWASLIYTFPKVSLPNTSNTEVMSTHSYCSTRCARLIHKAEQMHKTFAHQTEAIAFAMPNKGREMRYIISPTRRRSIDSRIDASYDCDRSI
jgi:hypothetical protein